MSRPREAEEAREALEESLGDLLDTPLEEHRHEACVEALDRLRETYQHAAEEGNTVLQRAVNEVRVEIRGELQRRLADRVHRDLEDGREP